MQVVMFSKHLQELSVEEAGRAVKAIGLDGLDLTVRPGGHLQPDNVRETLPKAVEALKAVGAEVPMITTAVTDADETAQNTFAAAQECGIRHLKLGYWSYGGFGKLDENMANARAAIERIAQLAEERGVTACLHNHSGAHLTASGSLVARLLKGLNPDAVGAYIDPGHLTLEGGLSGWKLAMDEMKDRIRLVAVKDFGWFREESNGNTRWRQKLVPLKEGVVRWKEAFECLRSLSFDGVVSFHSEYQGWGSWKDLNTEEVLRQTKEDYEYMRPILNR